MKFNKLENVIFIGDSAGANLLIGVCYWAILNNFPLPKGLVLCYPAVNCFSKDIARS